VVKTTTTIMVTGHECEWGTVWKGGSVGGKGEKDGNTMHVYILKQQNETH
jgi:hypothetical protein